MLPLTKGLGSKFNIITETDLYTVAFGSVEYGKYPYVVLNRTKITREIRFTHEIKKQS